MSRPVSLHRRLFVLTAMIGTLLTPMLTTGARAANALPTGPPRISVGGGSVVEGHMTRRYIRIPVTLSWPASTTVTVDYATADITASAGPDYKAKAGKLTFKAGQTYKGLAVLVWPDDSVEGDETFALNLTNATNASIGIGTGIGTIIDDDPNPGPRVSIGDSTVPETCAGHPVPLSVVVTMSVMQNSAEVVQVSTTDGSATSPADYKGSTKNFTISSGQDLKQFKVPIQPDTVVEGTETLTVNLTVVSGAEKVGKATGTVTILDCDPN